MKILAICGSPRNGNTEALLKRILLGAAEARAQTDLVLLKEKKIMLCDGCGKCAHTKNCHIADDMQHIYSKMFAADVLILGSPNYFNNVSGSMKNFIDRFSPYWEENLKGKKAVLVVVGAMGRPSLNYPEDALKQFCDICGIRVIKSIKVKAEEAHEASKNHKLMHRCYKLGKALAEGRTE